MDEAEIENLRKTSVSSLKGSNVDAKFIYEEAIRLIDETDVDFLLKSQALVVAAAALNDTGEYAMGGEVFEELLNLARAEGATTLELRCIEGLARSWFYLGDRKRAVHLLETGFARAKGIKNSDSEKWFRLAIDEIRDGRIAFPQTIKPPSHAPGVTKTKWTSLSALQKRDQEL